MMDWLLKLPDFMLGGVIVAAAWFSFNYAVLADRAMAMESAINVVPACIQAIEDYEAGLVVPRIGMGEMLGIPELDRFEDIARELTVPRLLSGAEKILRCQCATDQAATKFDYAVHTASFRIIRPESVSLLSRRAIEVVLAEKCGALPRRV